MAFQQIHTFVSNSVTYYINVDFDTDAIDVVTDPIGAIIDIFVTEDDLLFAEGDTMATACVGTTKKNAIAHLEYPYVSIESILNSVDCGATPPNCNFSFDLASSTATNGNNTGSITVTPITAGSYQYSLDNSVWQTSPVFNFLYPGNYQVYVRNILGCLRHRLIVVANQVITTLIPADIPYWDTQNICYFFRLIIDGVTHAIREPLKWDGVNIMGERNADFHGYQFKYTDGNVSLGFDCDSGMDLIEAVYAEFGQDGEIIFQYGYSYKGTDYILFPGKLMLNDRKNFVNRVECTVESEDLDSKFTARLDTKVSMMQDKTFDDSDVTPPTPYSLSLHAKEILTKLLSDTSTKSFESFAFSPATDVIYIKADNSDSTITEILDNYTYPLGDQVSDPVTVDEYILDLKTAGTATIEVNMDMDVQLFRGLPLTAVYEAKVILARKKYNTGTSTYQTFLEDITTTPVTGPMSQFTNFNIKGAYTGSESFLIGDKVYCYIVVDIEHTNKIKTKLNQINFKFNVTYLEASVATPAKVWFLEDVIKHTVAVIGDNRYAVRSSFYERMNAGQLMDGCGSKNIVTNGFQIRQFEADLRPLKIDFKSILESLSAIHCIGIIYTNDAQGSYVKIERADYFYQEREILAIHELEDYREEVAIDIIYNELNFGYDKFQSDGYNSLDEFNTKHEELTPIKKNKKKLVKISSLITSGYSIETIRRDQFRDKPSSSVSNDEEPFLISVKRENGTEWSTEKNEAFETVTGIISPSTAYNLRHSPKRMLYNWFIWLKGIFSYKQSADKITVTNVLQNNDLVTKFNVDETCRVGDVDRATIEEKASVPMSALASTRDIYRPERVFIKCRLSPVEVQTINLALTGRYDSTKDFGYLMVQKPNGVWQAVWIDKLSYNYFTEKAEISGKMKFTSPEAPVTPPCCAWLVVNGCYIKANGDKLIA